MVFHYGRGVLEAYIPSKGRGRNILKSIKEDGKESFIISAEETDAEVLFRFHSKNMGDLEKYLKPKTNGSNISPYSSKNLPKTKYVITDEDLDKYKEIVKNVPQNEMITLAHMSNDFLKSLITKRHTWEDIKADMAIKGLKGKEYMHYIGKWDEYLMYIKNNLHS